MQRLTLGADQQIQCCRAGEGLHSGCRTVFSAPLPSQQQQLATVSVFAV